jgi:hypothetical protein
MTSFISFAHRRNNDSTVDSICTRCYQTIANAQDDSSLTSAEANHICDPDVEMDRCEEISHYHHLSEALLRIAPA